MLIYQKPIYLLLSEYQCSQLEQYKMDSGMSYNAILDKSLTWFFQQEIVPERKPDARHKGFCGEAKNKRKKFAIQEQTYDALLQFCEKYQVPISLVCVAALSNRIF